MRIKLLIGVGVVLGTIAVGASPASAARVLDANVTAGAQTSPDTSWLTRVAPCTRYVAPGGSDTTGTGAADKPWKTIKLGASRLQPGNTLCVQPGSYREANIVPAVPGTSSSPIAIKALGSPGAVTILPATTAPASEQPFFNLATNAPVTEVGYLLVDNFTMNKQQHDGIGFYLVGSGNGVHHVAIQNNVIVNSKAPAGITVRGRSHNILIKGNTITGHSRWVLPDKTDPQYVGPPTHLNHRRFDAHAIAIEGTNLTRSVETVRIEGNILKNNGGDGVQCLGVNDDAGAFSGDPTDIDIVDNRVQNDPGSSPVEENGFDIKSCNRVSIRGRTPNAGEALGQNSKISELLPTTRALDWGGGNFANGDAIVVHYHARNVLIQNTRMWNVCNGIIVGRNDATVQHKVQNVVIRRNLIFSQRYKQTSANGAPQDADRCRGRGIQITNADNVDLYHNTLDGVPTTALQVGDSGGPAVPNNVDIWNNIFVLSNSVGAEPRYWINIVAEGANVDSDYNLFWHQNGRAAGDNHFAIRNTRMTLSQWRATDRDIVRSTLPRSAWDDPRFVADPTSNDYFTQPGSPARDAALHNTGSTYCQVRPDIGFLESCT